jgi:DNA-binding response OmpR family regulator
MTRNTVRKPAILIVDDDPSIRTFIQRILARHGYASIEAADASQGLSAFALDDVEIWLAIVDMILPGNAGLDLAAELGRRQPGLRILYISGCVDSIAMEAIARSSPEHVLLKPFTEALLIDRARRLMARPSGIKLAGTDGIVPKSA